MLQDYLYLTEFKSYGEGLQFLNSLDAEAYQLIECFPTESGSLVYFLSEASDPQYQASLVGKVDESFMQILLGKTGANLNSFTFVLESGSAASLLVSVVLLLKQNIQLVEIRFAKSRADHFAVLTAPTEIQLDSLKNDVRCTSIQTKKTLKQFFS